jgi:hypothetical protein
MERVKSTVFAGMAVLALASAAVAVTGPAGHAAAGRPAATAACGATCVALASEELGVSYVTDASGAGAGQTGQAVILSAAGQFTGEDFQQANPGTVAQFVSAGVFGATMSTWSSYPVYEYQYTPNGTQSGLCLGIGATAADGTKVTLQPCGVNARTCWVPLEIDEISGYQPLINGTDTDVDTPFVLTTSSTGDKLTTHKLDLVDGTFNPAQMWQTLTGVL